MDLATIVTILAAIFTVVTFIVTTSQLQTAVRTALWIDIQKTIERIERNKAQFQNTAPDAYKELFDIQQELEALNTKVLNIFKLRKLLKREREP